MPPYEYDPWKQYSRVMRMQNLFAPASPMSFDQPDDVMPNYDITNRLDQLYQPQNQVSDMYSQSLMDYPQRTNPGWLSRVSGVMAGLGAGVRPFGIEGGQPIGFLGNPSEAAKTYDAIANRPYYEQLQDWSIKNKALGEGAEQENRYNINQRQLATQILNREIDERRLEETERKNRATENIQQDRLKIQQQRADAYTFKSTHPDYKSYIDKDGMLVFVNTNNPEDIVKTELDTGKLSDYDKINLQISGRLQAIKAQGTETRKNIDVRAAEEEKLIGKRGEVQKELINTRASKKAITKPISSTQERIQLLRKAEEARNTHPEWSKYIKIVPGGGFAITSPGILFGPSEATYKEINKFIYETKSDPLGIR